MQVASNANSRAESEKPNESTLERKLRLTRNQGRRDLVMSVMSLEKSISDTGIILRGGSSSPKAMSTMNIGGFCMT